MLDRCCVLQIDRLISYGADVLKPVLLTQGERMAVGTAVDYGYFRFYQVWLRSEQDPLETCLLGKARSPQPSLFFQVGGLHDGTHRLWASVCHCLCPHSHIAKDGEAACSIQSLCNMG